jgi:hypothetical protein
LIIFGYYVSGEDFYPPTPLGGFRGGFQLAEMEAGEKKVEAYR